MRLRAIASLALLVLGPSLARAESASAFDVQTDTLRITFARAGGDPTHWEACQPGCTSPRTRQEFSAGPSADSGLAFRAERRDDDAAIVLVLSSEPRADGVVLRKTWRIPRRGYAATLALEIEGAGAESFARAHPLGFAVEPRAGQASVELDGWRGVRSRFWTLVARREAGDTTTAQSFRIYAGPIARAPLRAEDPALEGLLFPHLWFWMRWLALGLQILLGALCRLTGNPGIAIILLAVCVKILMRPLSGLAERWQRDVNEMQSRLQPQIESIKATSRGAERSERLLALHRENGVSPLFGLKSLLSVAIQIPIFFAAYHALDEAFVLDGVSFLWISNLAEPDALAALPRALPFFGPTLNALPFAMSAVTLVSSRLHDDGTLAPGLLRRQRVGLYAMALAFFLLFYSFPAGMVLYWTSNNLIALAWEAASRRLPRFRDQSGGLGLGSIHR